MSQIKQDFSLPTADIYPNTPKSMPVHWVRTTHELYKLIDEIDSVNTVALDTEFIKRTTYYPILALVQINTGHAIYLVDAPKLNLSDFWAALSEVPTMIWYACGEDLSIFYSLSKCPPLTNVFDAQIGIAYLTGRIHMGYRQAVSEFLGIELNKSESQSDWLQRPLSHQQETYAINDVLYLPYLYKQIVKQLNQKNILACVQEDCNHYAKTLHKNLNTPVQSLYLELIDPKYSRRQLAVLQQLVIWRENLAKSTNRPRNSIISKQALREIVIQTPCTMPSLARTTINRVTLRLYGKEIIKIIGKAKVIDIQKLPPKPRPLYHSKNKPFKKSLQNAVTVYSEKNHIPANLLLKNQWINELLFMVAYDQDGHELPEVLTGYRKDWIKQEIMPLLSKHKAHILQAFELPAYED